MIWAIGFTAAAATGLVWAEWRHSPIRYFAKPLASAGFVMIGVLALDLGSAYGLAVMAGLTLGAVGDVALLGRGDRSFLFGLGSFLMGHLALTVAFVTVASAALPGVPIALVFSALVWRRLGRHVTGNLRIPVVAYIAVITLMLAGAVGAGASHPLAAIGAGALAVSDIAVARDKFVSPGVTNRLWGLPLYYLGQVFIALSG